MTNTADDSATTTPHERFEVLLDGRNMAAMMDESERKMLAWAMTQTQGNQRQAAQKLGVSYSTFKMKIARHNLRAIWS